ncbi:hypothetical protein PR202_ga27921 [Eleusine coracana subsp. coracana]|uniref:Uncharacterized protein n=1 Tax=Eleusine coracana subsp. coracana TaxID=191504 RepID=A0AAV5DH80_ELECO|nr:hypothetical protein PR202_ga27921 [Eleusine coracana subsp. coracana]
MPPTLPPFSPLLGVASPSPRRNLPLNQPLPWATMASPSLSHDAGKRRPCGRRPPRGGRRPRDGWRRWATALRHAAGVYLEAGWADPVMGQPDTATGQSDLASRRLCGQAMTGGYPWPGGRIWRRDVAWASSSPPSSLRCLHPSLLCVPASPIPLVGHRCLRLADPAAVG